MPVFIAKYFWVAALAIAALNTAIAASRSRGFVANDPSLREGYRQMLRHYFLWSTLPWLIVGAGILVGDVPSIFHFFQPRHGDPFVLAFHGFAILVWILFLYWVFVRDGAEMLVRYPGFISPAIRHIWMIKGLVVFTVSFGVMAEVAMWIVDIPIGDFLART